MKRGMLLAILLAGVTTIGTAYGDQLSQQEKRMFGPDGITLTSQVQETEQDQSRRLAESRSAVEGPVCFKPCAAARDDSRNPLQVWWR